MAEQNHWGFSRKTFIKKNIQKNNNDIVFTESALNEIGKNINKTLMAYIYCAQRLKEGEKGNRIDKEDIRIITKFML